VKLEGRVRKEGSSMKVNWKVWKRNRLGLKIGSVNECFRSACCAKLIFDVDFVEWKTWVEDVNSSFQFLNDFCFFKGQVRIWNKSIEMNLSRPLVTSCRNLIDEQNISLCLNSLILSILKSSKINILTRLQLFFNSSQTKANSYDL